MSIQITSVTKDTGIVITPDISTSTLYDAGQVFSIAAPSGYKISEIDYGFSTATPDTISIANATLSPLLPYVSVVPNASTIEFTLPPQTVPGTVQHYRIVLKKVLVQIYFKDISIGSVNSSPTINTGTLYNPGTVFTLTAPLGQNISAITFYASDKSPTEADSMTEETYDQSNFKGNISVAPPVNSTALTLPSGEGKSYVIMVTAEEETHKTTKKLFERCLTEFVTEQIDPVKAANRYLWPITYQVGESRTGWGGVVSGSSGGVSPAAYIILNDANEVLYGHVTEYGGRRKEWFLPHGARMYDFGGTFEKAKGWLPKFIGGVVMYAEMISAPAINTAWSFSASLNGGYVGILAVGKEKYTSVLKVSTAKGITEPPVITETFYPKGKQPRVTAAGSTGDFTNPSGPTSFIAIETRDYGATYINEFMRHRYITEEMIEEIVEKNQIFSHTVTFEFVDGVLYIDAPPEEVEAMAGKYYEKQINTDDCDIVTWEIASQDIPSDPLAISSTGFVSGAIPLTVPPGDYTVVIKATNSVGSVRFLTLSITVTEYDVSDTWEVLGSTATAIKYVLHHSDDYFLLVDSTRYIYKTTDFVTFDTVYDAGTTVRVFTRPHELADKTVLLGMSKAGSNPTYSDSYSLLSDATCSAFTERQIHKNSSTGNMLDMIISESDATHAIAAVSVSNKTYIHRILISDGSKTTSVNGATTSGDKKRLWNMEVAGAGTSPWDKLIFNNVGTSGQPGDNDIWSTLNATNWTLESDNSVSNGTNSAPTNKIFYKDTDGNWYVKNNTAIYTSTDAGDTWTLVNAGVAQDILNPVFLMVTDDLFLQAESGTTNGRIFKSKNACVDFTANYTLTNGAKPVILYKDWKGRVLLVTTGTTNNILRAA